jgi:hypothetical protein
MHHHHDHAGVLASYLMSWVSYILLGRTSIPPDIGCILGQCWAVIVRPYPSYVFHIYESNERTGKKKVNNRFRLVEMYLNATCLCKGADEVVLTTKSGTEKGTSLSSFQVWNARPLR